MGNARRAQAARACRQRKRGGPGVRCLRRLGGRRERGQVLSGARRPHVENHRVVRARPRKRASERRGAPGRRARYRRLSDHAQPLEAEAVELLRASPRSARASRACGYGTCAGRRGSGAEASLSRNACCRRGNWCESPTPPAGAACAPPQAPTSRAVLGDDVHHVGPAQRPKAQQSPFCRKPHTQLRVARNRHAAHQDLLADRALGLGRRSRTIWMSCPSARSSSTKRAALFATPFTSGGHVSVTMRCAASGVGRRDARRRSDSWRAMMRVEYDRTVTAPSPNVERSNCGSNAAVAFPPHVKRKETPMRKALRELAIQRWDDHRYYHHSRINQSLHFVSATSFLCAYACFSSIPCMPRWSGGCWR